MTDPKDHLLSWLRHAHAAEEQAITMLSNLARRIESYRELKARIDEHITETQRQSERVRECLRRHGSDACIAGRPVSQTGAEGKSIWHS